mgnify:FL=1
MMDGAMTFASIIPLVAVLFGALVSALLGMLLSGQKVITTNLTKLNGRLAEHVENKDLHYAHMARTDERINALLKAVEVAPTRIDSVKGRG